MVYFLVLMGAIVSYECLQGVWVLGAVTIFYFFA